jgi:hypothetical protein
LFGPAREAVSAGASHGAGLNVSGNGTAPGPLSLEEVDGVLLVDAWFRRQSAEAARTLEAPQARALCE